MNTIKSKTGPRVAEPSRAQNRTKSPLPAVSVDQSRSRQSGLVFKTLLGIAACLALAGVVAQADAESSRGTGVADPPPSVFVQTDN